MTPSSQPNPAGAVEGVLIAPPAETIYLRPCRSGGWSVHLEEHLLLVTREEEEAFQRACEAAVIDGQAPRRMLLLSGPGAAVHDGVPALQRARAAE